MPSKLVDESQNTKLDTDETARSSVQVKMEKGERIRGTSATPTQTSNLCIYL